MKALFPRIMFLVIAAFIAVGAYAQNAPPLPPNQTFGFGAGQLLRFTYTQSFSCVDQPTSDLNFNGIVAASDPNEQQIPICQVGTQPSINPPGVKGNPKLTTDPLYVLVPMFSVDSDQNPNDAISCDGVVPGTLCGPDLGATLITLFGALPEAFKAKAQVYTQCPEPLSAPGTCTMHASRLDLGPALVALGLVPPPPSNIFLPTPNHSHVLASDDINKKAEWWQVIPVLVFNPTDWPSADASQGITSVAALKTAVNAGDAVQVPSNFFLYFSSYTMMAGHAH